MKRQKGSDPASEKTLAGTLLRDMKNSARHRFTSDPTTRDAPERFGLVGQDRGYPVRQLDKDDRRIVVMSDRAIADALGVRVGFVKRLVEIGRVAGWHGSAPSYAWRAYNIGFSDIPGQMHVTPVRWWIPRASVRAIASMVTRADLRPVPARAVPNKTKQDAADARRARRQQANISTGKTGMVINRG